ncbi:class I SAM-dependent methyltransferase [candidate division KSB1 bacterium]|nr:class I SAM-dependent methyltransferase [candidate division KSB1 bacterium]
MTKMRSAQEVFNDWGQEDGGSGMETEHWPRVSQVLSRIAPSNGNYLELGVGSGYALEYMATHAFSGGHCYGLDISDEMVKTCRKRLAHLKNVTAEAGDFLQWQPPAVRFDLIFSMEVFYYFEDMQAGLNKAADLLAPGGELLVMVDFYHENSVTHSWPEDVGTPMTLWSESQYVEGFSKAGLVDVRQELIAGGNSEHGLTLCTGGKIS